MAYPWQGRVLISPAHNECTKKGRAMGKVNELLDEITLPKMIRIKQKFDADSLSSIEKAVYNEMMRPEIRAAICPGMRIAVTAGSRGIKHYPEILRSIVNCLKTLNAIPFIIPAMGSHGGAIAEGQTKLLNGLGITEDSVGAPIVSSMDVVKLGETERGVSVWFSKDAYEADATILVGRIKPHTAFHGLIESGVVKMGVIGCGKQRGAEEFHSLGLENMSTNIVEMWQIMMAKSNVAFGIAVLENAYDETFRIEAMLRENIIQRESKLLLLAKEHFARIMFSEYDVLVVERIGKNISGDGADPNITGRFYSPSIPDNPKVQRLVYLDLTEESSGNAIGIGVADFITRRLFDKVGLESMYMNTVTNCVVQPAKIPLIMDTDELAIKAGVRTLIHADKNRPRIIIIKDSLHLEEIEISEALFPEALANPNIEILSEPRSIEFTSTGSMIS